MSLIIPPRLAAACSHDPAREHWLATLPAAVRMLQRRWCLVLDEPFAGEDVSCSWVAPARLADGRSAVLKLGMPHMEGEDEIEGLRFWNGDGTVHLLDAAADPAAMLLERCQPGTPLRSLPEPEQDVVIAQLLRRLWRIPSLPHPFRPLSVMTEHWTQEAIAQAAHWPDEGLVREGLRLFHELTQSEPENVLLATDLHAGNVLSAEREPWLVIDPKPFLGDPAFDATQHLFNCPERLRADPCRTIERLSDLLGVSDERVRLWTFARAAAEPRDNWTTDWTLELARSIAPS